MKTCNMVEYSNSIVKHDEKKAGLKNFAKVGPCVRENFKLVFEKLSGGSVLIVLSRCGGISGYIGQCPLQLCQGYYILKQNGSSFILSRQIFSYSF